MGPLLMALLAFAAPEAAGRTGAALEGTAWKLLIDRAALPEGFWSSDLLLFVDGRFAAVECLAHGFAPAEYAARVERGLLIWSASQDEPGGVRLLWSGIRRGSRMTGLLLWKEPGRDPVELSWKAILRPKPAALPRGF